MNKLTDFSLKNPAAIIIISVLLFIAGVYSAMGIKQESMPKLTIPMVFVTTSYTAPPKDVMEDVTKKLEKALKGFKGVKKITSSSEDNFSTVTVELIHGRDPEKAKIEIESVLQNVELPKSASKPKVSTFNNNSLPIYNLSINANEGTNQQELNRIYKEFIEPTLSTMDGVGKLEGAGNEESTLEMKLNVDAINSFGLAPENVSESIQAAVKSSPAGTAEFNGNNQMVRIKSDLDTIYHLENMKITTPSGNTVRLTEVARVKAISETKFPSRLNGQPAISVTLYKGQDVNEVQFADNVDKLITQWKQDYPNLTFTTVSNSAIEIKKSINGMLKEGMMGAILASVMILLFLKNIRMTFIVLVSIPLSILITLSIMAPLDITLNIMTLGGLTIAVGRVVDDSIVVIENIYEELHKAQERNESVIRLATAQVASAITSSTITTAGVFIPIAFVTGTIGDIFRPFAITLVVALMSSLIVALTVIPMLAKLMVLNNGKLNHQDVKAGRFSLSYKKFLNWSLINPTKTIFASLLIFVLTIGATVPFLPVTFIPESDSDKQIQYEIKLPRDNSINNTGQMLKEIETMMSEAKDSVGAPAFNYIMVIVGRDSSSVEGNRVGYRAKLIVAVSENSRAKSMILEYKEKMLYLLPKGSEVEGTLLSSAESGSTSSSFSYVLKSQDQNQLVAAAERVKAKMMEFPELIEIKDSLSEKKSQVEVSVDQNKARLHGLSSDQITQTVGTWLAEVQIGDLRFDNVTYKTKVMLDEEFKNSVDKIGKFHIRTSTGTIVYLNDIAKIKMIDAPATINRQNQEQYVSVTAKINSDNKGGVSNQVSASLQTLDLPSGVRAEVQGVSQDIDQGFGQLVVAMVAAIFIIYLVMVIAFGNASAPFVIMFSLPLAAIGGFLGLYIAKESINVTSLIGFLMLIGVVVTNAIVLVDRVQQLREMRYSVRDALIEAGMTRLRPIIMTAGATIFSLMPLALGFSEGTVISKGLAVVVIGGLITSTILTLVVVPVMYEIIESMKRQIGRLFSRKRNPVAAFSASGEH
jgi:multidrug efflux pump subunit AcrB